MDDRLFPPPRALPSQASLDRLVTLALRIMREVGGPIDAQEKMALSAYLFEEGPEFVQEVARALAEHPGCFPEIPVDPAELEQGLRRASRWLSLREFGLMITRIADDHYAVETAAQVKTALAVLQHVRADRRRLSPMPGDDERRSAMALAEDTWAAYRRRLRKK